MFAGEPIGRPHIARALLLLALGLAALGAWWASVPPAPLGDDAPPAMFAAGRAMADVRWIGRAPHPAGSAEHARVRGALIGRMAALGLAPRIAPGRAIRTTVRAGGTSVSGADVLNLIGTMSGRDRAAPAVLLMAHYDSVPSSPGAADDGAGVAAALEIVRALRTGPPPTRDVVLLVTDAEENGLLGARAFFAGDPDARRIGFVVNMDVRGDAGRAIMHETGAESGGAIDLYRRAAIHPTTDSIAAYVERLIRNSSDFRIAVDHGLSGLNFAFLDGQFDYHAASSTPATLDRGTLQHLGEQVLAVVRAAATASALPSPSADPAYASVLGQVVIAYPTWVGWLIVAAALALGAIAWRRSGVPTAAALRATGVALHLLLTLALALILARLATGVPFGFTVGRPLLARWALYEAALALLCGAGVTGWWAMARAGAWRTAAVAPLALLTAVALGGGTSWIVAAMGMVAALLAVPAFAAPMPPRAIGFGLFGAVALLALLMQALAPVAAVGTTWALLGGAVALLAATWRRCGLVVVAIAASFAAQAVATAHLLLLAVGETIAAVAAPFALYAALPLAPLPGAGLGRRLATALATLCGAGAVVLLLMIRFGDPASVRRPGLSQILHVTDLANGRSYRATSLAFPDRWTLAALARASGETALLPMYDHAFVAPAEPARIAPPRITSAHLPDGRVMLRVAAAAGTREVRLAVTASAPIRRAWVNGIAAPLLERTGRIDRIEWVGRDPVVTLLLMPAGPGRLVARISTLADGWPAGAKPLPPRAATTMPWYDSDTSLVLATAKVVW